MRRPYVCPGCRHGLYRSLQPSSRANFISLAKTKPEPPAADQQQQQQPPTKLDHVPQKKKPSAPPGTKLPHLLQDASKGGSSRYSAPWNQPEAEQPTQAFPPIRRPGVGLLHSPGAIAVGLDEILNNPESTVGEAWAYFQAHYTSNDCPALAAPSLQDLLKVLKGNVFSNLLTVAFREWCDKDGETNVPSPVELVGKYNSLGIMRESFWDTALSCLAAQVLRTATTPPADRKRPQEALANLMVLWRAFYMEYGKLAKPEIAHIAVQAYGEEWSFLPPPFELTKTTTGANNTESFEKRLQMFLPRLPLLTPSMIGMSALLTFDMLTREDDPLGIPQSAIMEYRPFAQFIAHLVPMSNVARMTSDMEDYLLNHGVTRHEVDGVIGRLRNSGQRVVRILGTANRSRGQDERQLTDEERLDTSFYKRIARAAEGEQPERVWALWEQARNTFPPRDLAQKDKIVIPNRIYHLVLEKMMQFGQPQQAIQVWNTMVANGVRPDVRAWTAMLTGCRNARDSVTLEQLWGRMLDSGIQPDAFAWSTRIHGFMVTGNTRRAMECLEDMGQIWLAAKRAQESGKKKRGAAADAANAEAEETKLPPRPTIEVINTVVTVMSRRNLHRELARVLNWARSFGIPPDVVTFNTLISMALRNENSTEAMTLLGQMDEAGVAPDVATFAIILNSVFRSPTVQNAGPEVQNTKVLSVLQNMEKRGLTPNAFVFATLVDGLLKMHKNFAAAAAVLAYMRKKDVPISPHVYTILLTHYFDAAEAPDFAAVEALWSEIQAKAIPVDAIFYDRMIEKYAHVGELGKAMTTLSRMSREGKSPGWVALDLLCRCLAFAGDWDRFLELVRDVMQGKGVVAAGLQPTRPTVVDAFWRMVEDKMSLMPRSDDGKVRGLDILRMLDQRFRGR
ncbi:uncharacterized protein K452DRAFT_268739 [Aplosporella prunicola CBS 121167]|uniref:Pentacotripeptide-repeat region of PRORP domain-containing protein n=1 Tax=Aplosporella prunicola CBS 121167 TaxID=1176127 RepID=A0A6A6BJ30_9PEZI|nr:uncharacterized protein K452DRAFT_268739 [Aplosporella prunicola CBS 121167]KAF2143315.1 hypothetical protein K452DRAFT_268739 [Aplosporella prunicola CBS 121167]